MLFLFVTALVGGAMNAVGGGGSFLALPALMYAGVPPVAANATTTFALWPASVSAVFAYRRELAGRRRWLLQMGTVSLVGGWLGAVLLVRTSDTSFMRLLPWLMLLAAVTFTSGGRVVAWARARRGRDRTAQDATHTAGAPPWILVLQLAIAAYGGYFGGGMGFMMLAALALAGHTDIHVMNGMKSSLGVAINGMALATFLLSGAVVWIPGLVMVLGGVLGGYAGASAARRLPSGAVRPVVVLMSWGMSLYFFLR